MEILLVVFFWLLLSGVVGGEARKRRNRDPAYWMAFAAFFSPPIAYLILMLTPRRPDISDIKISE